MFWRCLFLFVLLVPFATAATLHGTIYGPTLEVVDDVKIKIDTVPQQRLLATEGRYELVVPPGEYALLANADGLEAKETVSIREEGTYVLDIFLFPTFEEEEELYSEADLDVDVQALSLAPSFRWGALPLTLLFLLVLWATYRRWRRAPQKAETPTPQPRLPSPIDESLQRILAFIDKEGGRTTQVAIRKAFPQSEAKTSLQLTELEAKGYVRKIKKGKSNVILRTSPPA